MKKWSVVFVLLGLSLSVQASEGMISVQSKYAVKQTADRLVTAIEKKGAKVFLRLDHAAGAKSVGREQRPTELVIFGNPKLGSALMACVQNVGIDLPMKALISEDNKGQTWVSYNDSAFLAHRHAIDGCEGPLKKAAGILRMLTSEATQ